MVQAVSLFNQRLRLSPKLEFAAQAKKHNAERAAEGFSCRTQLMWMLHCQRAHADSLRKVWNGLACRPGKMTHLGSDEAPSKSTLSYANNMRKRSARFPASGGSFRPPIFRESISLFRPSILCRLPPKVALLITLASRFATCPHFLRSWKLPESSSTSSARTFRTLLPP